MKLRPADKEGKHLSNNDRIFRKKCGYPLTWTCSICGKWRLDDKISVYTTDVSEKMGLDKGTVKQNTRYCNDNENCIKKAKQRD